MKISQQQKNTPCGMRSGLLWGLVLSNILPLSYSDIVRESEYLKSLYIYGLLILSKSLNTEKLIGASTDEFKNPF